jgi:hypothetical protein
MSEATREEWRDAAKEAMVEATKLRAQLAAVEKERDELSQAVDLLKAVAERAGKERDEAIDKAIDYMAACTKAETERDAATGALAAAQAALKRWRDEYEHAEDCEWMEHIDAEEDKDCTCYKRVAAEFLSSPAADLAARHDAEVERRALEKAAAVCEQRVIRETDTEERGHHVVDDWKYPIEGEEIASEIRALATPTPEKP